MKLLYFAWLREKIGTSEEVLALPEGVGDVKGLIDFLKARGEAYANAFEEMSSVKVAVNQDFAKLDNPITDEDEIAFFPPVTGG